VQGEETDDQFSSRARTRCGRLSRLPLRISTADSTAGGSLDAVAETQPAVAEVVPQMVQTPSLQTRRNFTPPARYVCKVCGKLYLGDRKMSRHLKHFPSHGFATPEPPAPPAGRRPPALETQIQELEASALLDLVGPRLFQSFSMWELLIRKTSSRGLGTVEALMSVMGDMQALVMELKNLVEQCLASERAVQNSGALTLSPVMSAVLGLSHSGGVTRYVLPYNQVPSHYHKLLGFPTGLQGSPPSIAPGPPPSLLSPSSTTSLIHPEEENSQMSLSSDCPDLPLGDKVVLEDNLGSRALQDLDESTQDSGLTAPSPPPQRPPHGSKRPRLDSSSFHSAPSPTPDFLSQGEDSNTSSVSTLEPHNVKAKVSKVEEVEASSADTSVRTKLPSFSSIIMSTSPPEQPVVASPQQELASPTNFPSTFTTASPTRAPSPSPSSSPAFPQNAPVLHSAPGSPTLHYPTSSTYPRRASLGATQRLSDECAAALILGLSRGDMVSPPDTSAEEHANFQRFRTVAWSAASPPPTSTWSSPSTPTSTWSSPPPPTSAWTSVPSLTTWTSASPSANSAHSAARNTLNSHLIQLFQFWLFSKVSESQFRNCELPKFLGGQNARF